PTTLISQRRPAVARGCREIKKHERSGVPPVDNGCAGGILLGRRRAAAGGVRPRPATPQGETIMQPLNRRQLLQGAGAGVATLSLGPLANVAQAQPTGFTLPKLPYNNDALEPHIDAQTMMIHHDRHHQAYVTNLNNALAGHPDLLKMDINALMREI